MTINARLPILKRAALFGAAVVVSGLTVIPSAWAGDVAHQASGANQPSAIAAGAAQPPQCFERPITLPPGTESGTSGDDVMVGTGDPNTIQGRTGDDRICGRGGNDLLFGGPGDDRVHGNSGNDSVFGDAGNDLLFGGADNDALNGGPGFDRCDGGPGNDTAVTTGPNRCEVVVNVP